MNCETNSHSLPGILLLVLDLVSNGKTAKEIGEALHNEGVEHASERTVKRWKANILNELGADNMLQALAMAYERKILPIRKH